MLEGAIALERAGAGAWCSSWCPRRSPRLITERIGIPTIGIGAGADCDGQVLVFHDMVGMFSGFTPTFVKRYAEAGAAIQARGRRYAAEVRDGASPGEGKSFGMKDEVLQAHLWYLGSAGAAEALALEAARVLAAEGLALTPAQAIGRVMEAAKITARNRSSMLQDVLAGRRTENDHLTGALLRLARRHRVAVPTHAAFHRLICVMERGLESLRQPLGVKRALNRTGP